MRKPRKRDRFPPDEPVQTSTEEGYEEYTLAELEEMLQKAVENEEYERASMIRDEISKRKKR
jgi:uncharacterized protein